MLQQANPNSVADHGLRNLDDIVEAFEATWNLQTDTHFQELLPPTEHPQYREIAVELICIDLERRWNCGEPRSIQDYRSVHTDLLACPRVLERVAFEEYRLRLQANERVTPQAYAKQFEIETDHWPQPGNVADVVTAGGDDFSSSVVGEMQRIAGVCQFYPSVGDQFLDFEIVERLGSARHDQVYLARQNTLADRLVVLKFTTELWTESNRMARLQHSNVIPVFSVHQHEDLQAVCMPFLGRHTLASALRVVANRRNFSGAEFIECLNVRQGTGLIPVRGVEGAGTPQRNSELASYLQSLEFERLCIWIISRVAKGLAHAHDRGLLHRDLKPANILITDEGQPMILDFNLSEETERSARASDVIGGTLPYMSPEHLRAMKSTGRVDVRSDVYSVGVVLYQLLTGELPFPPLASQATDQIEDLENQQLSVVPSVRNSNQMLSIAVDSIVKHCLQADPARRYQSAAQLQDDLQRQLEHRPLKYAPNRSKRELASKWVRRHPRLTSGAAIATASAVLLFFACLLLVAVTRQVASYRAESTFRHFVKLTNIAKAPLSSPSTDTESRRFGLRRANEAAAVYNLEDADWESEDHFRLLSQTEQSRVRQLLSDLHCLMAYAISANANMISNNDERHEQLLAALHQTELAKKTGITSAAVMLQEAGVNKELGNDVQEKWQDAMDRLSVPDSPLDGYFAALNLIRYGEDSKAKKILEASLAIQPENSFHWFLLGNCHFVAEEYAKAESCYSSSAALWPEFYAGYFHRGICRFYIRRFEQAEADFERVLELEPTHTTAMFNRALARMELGQFEAAVSDLNEAIVCGKTDPLVYILRANAYEALGRNSEAQADKAAAVQSTPIDVDGWIQRGLARRHDDAEGALNDIEVAISLAPKSRQALQSKAYICSELMNDADGAISALSQLLHHHPGNWKALAARGLLFARQGKRDQACEDARGAITSNESANCFYRVARIFSQTSKQRPDDAVYAVQCLREAVRLDVTLAKDIDRDPDLIPISDRSDFRDINNAGMLLLDNNKS